MSGDYCKLSRQIQDCFLWGDEPFTRGQAWVDLIMLANYSDGHLRVRGILVPVARGQVGRSELTLAEKWKWSRGKVRRFLEELVQQNMVKIVQQKNKLTTLITIVNYGKWQDSDTTDSTTKRTTDSTTDSTTNGHQTDTNKNKKKKEKEDDVPYEQIVNDMNLALGKNYKHSTDSIRKIISARFKEGFTAEDFSKVVRTCKSMWKGDTNMEQYLRPETMFNGKFQSYLNTSISVSKPKQPNLYDMERSF